MEPTRRRLRRPTVDNSTPPWEENKEEEKEEEQWEKRYLPPRLIQDLIDQRKHVTKVDKLSLDEDWEGISFTVQRYGDALADMQTILSDYRRELNIKIRQDVLEKDKKPASEAKVENLISIDKHYIEICHIVAILQSTVDALHYKKKALEWLCQLYINQYFSIPSQKKRGNTVNNLYDGSNSSTEQIRRRLNERED